MTLGLQCQRMPTLERLIQIRLSLPFVKRALSLQAVSLTTSLQGSVPPGVQGTLQAAPSTRVQHPQATLRHQVTLLHLLAWASQALVSLLPVRRLRLRLLPIRLRHQHTDKHLRLHHRTLRHRLSSRQRRQTTAPRHRALAQPLLRLALHRRAIALLAPRLVALAGMCLLPRLPPPDTLLLLPDGLLRAHRHIHPLLLILVDHQHRLATVRLLRRTALRMSPPFEIDVS